MSNYYDALVNDFLVSEWRKEVASFTTDLTVHQRRPLTVRDEEHLVLCESTRFEIKGDPSWECDCYSEYTRGDVFRMQGDLFCDHGFTVPVDFRSGDDRHDVLQRLAEFEETQDCPYADY